MTELARRRRQLRRAHYVTVLTLGSGLLLAGCAGLQSQLINGDGYTRGPDVMDNVRRADLSPRSPVATRTVESADGIAAPTQVYEGTSIPALDAPPGRSGAAGGGGGGASGGGGGSGDGVTLNFENTPIAAVAQSILGDILKTGYTIDPRVMGMISLSSPRPVPKSDVLFVLENALRLSGVVMVKDVQGYRLIPLGDAVGAGNLDSTAAHAEPGYGVSVVPLQNVSAATLLKLIDSFATKPGTVRADTGRNLLLIQGTGAERKAAIDTVLSFDVDWMRGQSVGVFPLRNTAPEPVLGELEKILDSGEGGLSQNTVKLQPVTRMNAVLVVTRKPAMLRTVETWIKRLDAIDTSRAGVHVYHVRYAEARQLARVLNDIFIGNAGSSFDTASSQLGPRSGSSTSGDRLSQAGGGSGGSGGSFGGSLGGSGSGSSGGSSGGLGGGLGGGSSGGLGGGGGLGGSRSGSSGSSFGNSNSSLGRNNQSGTGTGSGSGLDSGLGGSSQGNGQPLMQDVRISADTVGNSVLIYATNENWQIISRTLSQLDRPQLQVAVEATVAEVDLNDTLAYGVQFFLQGSHLSVNNIPNTSPAQAAAAMAAATQQTAAAAGTATATSTNSVTAITSALGLGVANPGLNFLVGNANMPNMVLDALHNVTNTRILQNPSLVVLDNQVATLMVGSDVPIATGSLNTAAAATTGIAASSTTFDYRQTGIILRVIPRINVNGNVRLDVEQEVSSIATNTTTNSATGSNPTFTERKLKSSINVQNGQTVLLAGLIQEQQDRSHGGLPWLDQVPGLADALGHTNNTGMRTELIVFLRPQIVHDTQDASFIAEELRSKLRGTMSASPPDVPPSKTTAPKPL